MLSLRCCVLGVMYAGVMVCAESDVKKEHSTSGDRVTKRSIDAENFIRLYIDHSRLLSSLTSDSSSSCSSSSSSSSERTYRNGGSDNEENEGSFIQSNSNWIRRTSDEDQLTLGGAAYYQNEFLKTQNNPSYLSMFAKSQKDADSDCLARPKIVPNIFYRRTSQDLYNDEPRIFGGQEVGIRKHPYQLQLGVNGSQYCSASIISHKWALSAAQCLFDAETKTRRPDPYLTLRSGTDVRDLAGIVHMVERSIIHGQFDNSGRSADYDICLLKIFDSFEFSKTVQRISLPKEKYFIDDGKPVVVSGWGSIAEGEEGKNNTKLREAELRTVNQRLCSNSFTVPVTPRMICAGDETKGACQGDAGGPLVRGKLLVGIISLVSNECTATKVPVVSTRVSKFRDWIKLNSNV